jgi:sigma-B regulation protein RsbU (phosphoserine phosphatase)
LHGTDHVTLTLIKYEEQGKLFLSGAHDDPLIWRKRTGKCERLSSPGFWLGALEDIESMSSDLEVNLEEGDQLVLYTDGITEAMNGSHEQFGLNRLVAVIERHGTESPTQLCAAILLALANWSSTQIDDVSLVVACYQGRPRS